MVFYQPPARIKDHERSSRAEDLAADWDAFIGSQMSERDKNLFYNAATDTSPGDPSPPTPIPWNGFPRSIWQWCNADSDPDGVERALLAAETLRPFVFARRNGRTQVITWREGDPPMFYYNGTGLLPDPVVLYDRQQDEYCEWHVDRNEQGGITRIVYTAEAPDYWRQMAAIDLDLVVELYRENVDPAVSAEDLVWPFDVAIPDYDQRAYVLLPGSLRQGQYNPHNRFNTTHGLMHLTHPANTIGGQINLAAASTTLYPDVSPQPPSSYRSRLLCCTRFGGENRSSDPLIVSGVNGFAQAGLAVSIANPVGLYMSSIDIAGLADPAGWPIPQALEVTRQSEDGKMILRAVVTPPEGADYTLDECTFDQEPLQYGGQIARKITLLLFGIAKAIPGREAVSSACKGKCCANPEAPGFQQSVATGTECAALEKSFWDPLGPYFPPAAPSERTVRAADFEEAPSPLEATTVQGWQTGKVAIAAGATMPSPENGRS